MEPTPVAPVVPPVTQPEPTTPSTNNSMWLIIGGIILVIVLIAAGYFWYSNNNTATTQAPESSVQGLNTLVKELDAIEIGDIESDLTEIDKDLSQL